MFYKRRFVVVVSQSSHRLDYQADFTIGQGYVYASRMLKYAAGSETTELVDSYALSIVDLWVESVNYDTKLNLPHLTMACAGFLL